jgi:tRNA nucleotidyltransferase/poly(A) polymerase
MDLWAALDRYGHTVLVGGLVRDKVLGVTNDDQDYDFATIHRPSEVMSLLRERGHTVIPTGVEFGTVTIPVDGLKVEVTTFRSDTYDGESRKPMVKFGLTFREDAGRRDLTISSMGVDRNGTVLDHYGGIEDAHAGVIRAVGDAKARFTEDPLRILRAARFAGKFNFPIEAGTLEAMKETAPETTRLSRERISEELRKILLTDHPDKALNYLKFTGVLEAILPELDALSEALQRNNPWHETHVWGHTMAALKHAKKDYVTRLAVLYHDVGKPKTETYDEDDVAHYKMHELHGSRIWTAVAARDKLSNDLTERVRKLILHHLRPAHYTPKEGDGSIRRLLRELGDDWPTLADVSYADTMGHSLKAHIRGTEVIGAWKERMAAVAAKTPKGPLLPKGSGTALMDVFGLKPGAELGAYLKKAEAAILDGKLVATSTDDIVAFVSALRGECNACLEPERYDDHLCWSPNW